jgi:4-amino-4-deoxy-L-arabinose transferase-like glycosyltransferase
MVGVTIGVFLAYKCFAHTLITAMYEGRTIAILDGLIRYQSKKPVQYYLDLGDGLFFRLWLILGVGTTVLVFLGQCVSLLRNGASPGLLTAGRAEPGPEEPKLSWRHLAAIYGFSLLVRAVFLPFVTNLPLASDEKYYWAVSKNLMSGDFAVTVLRPPLWGYMLALPAAIYDHPFSGRVLSTLLGALVPVMVALLGRKVFDRKTGLTAAVLYALYPEHICYSHYVWSELFFGLLCVTVVYLFFSFAEDPRTWKLFVSCFVVAGITLITKEFAVIVFGALMVTLLCLRTDGKFKKIAVACILFASFATVYSAAASAITGRVIVLNDAILRNLNIAAGLESDQRYSFDNREDVARNVLASLRNTDLRKYVKRFKNQFFHLWSPNSFPIVRLIGQHRPEGWSYGVSDPWPYVYLLAGYYIAVMALGITGLCLARVDHFWLFAVVTLCGLSSTGAVAILCSRFRLPFMFIIVIYAAHLVVDRHALAANLRNPLRALALILLVWLFANIIAAGVPTFGAWG